MITNTNVPEFICDTCVVYEEFAEHARENFPRTSCSFCHSVRPCWPIVELTEAIADTYFENLLVAEVDSEADIPPGDPEGVIVQDLLGCSSPVAVSLRGWLSEWEREIRDPAIARQCHEAEQKTPQSFFERWLKWNRFGSTQGERKK